MDDDKRGIAVNGVSGPASVVGTRTSLRKTSQAGNGAISAPNDGASNGRGKSGTATAGKRGTKRGADGVPPVVDEDAIKQSLGYAMESDDDEGEEEGARFLRQRDKRRLLRVLTALSIPTPDPTTGPVAEESANARKRAKLLQLILDQAFMDESQSGNGTLRGMLAGAEKVKVDDLLAHVNMLAHALAPGMPSPFPTTSEEQRAKPGINPRLGGSRAKPIKDALLIDAFTTLAEVISTVLAPQKNGDVDPLVPMPKVRWALHQRLGMVPSSLGKGAKGPPQTVDWFSGAAESIDAVDGDAEGDVDMDGEEGPLTRMKRERAFANANVVIVPPPVAQDKAKAKPPTLDEVLFVHPSRANGKSQWKERRKGKGTQLRRMVQYPRYYSSFTPSFAPTHDSSAASNGFGYYQTWEAAMGKASVHSWMTSGWNGAYGADFEPSEDTSQVEEYRPRASRDDIQELLESLVEDTTMEIDPALVDAVDQTQREMRELQKRLDQNAVWVRQLQQYQEIRVRRGQREPLEEEDRIARRLQESLVDLASTTTPAALLPKALREAEEPIAVVLARKVIHTSAPSVRGTLDPARPKALSDNTTAVARAPDQVAPPIARPPPVVANAPRSATLPGMMRVPSNPQWQGSQKIGSGVASPQPVAYSPALSMQRSGGGSRYAFPPQSTPGLSGGRSSPIAPINSVPSVLRNSLPQPVGLGSFSPLGRSTLTPTNAAYGQSGQSGRGIGSAMGMSMNNPGMTGSPVPAFRPSNTIARLS